MRSICVMVLCILCISCKAQLYDPTIEALLANRGLFPFGVASGDPRPNQVVLWTKLAPTDLGQEWKVKWEIATDTLLTQVVAQGVAATDSSSAFTLMVEPDQLAPATTYYYRFSANGQSSAIGRTRTAPENPTALRFAVVSCSNYLDRFFNGYALIANRADLDAVIHLGDYIYEYGGDLSNTRQHIPAHDIVSLRDYRSRYAQYRLDPDLAEMHRLHPIIAIWDDHEFANDSHRSGARNHMAHQGEWNERSATAKRAWFEWLPTMTREEQTVVRSFSFGELADLFMIDGRLQRDQPVASYHDSIVASPKRTKLGEQQTSELTNWLSTSEARWKILGNNVMFAPVDLGRFAKDRRWNMDAWDGFPANRAQILDSIEAHQIRNVVVITGDIHMAWCLELVRDPHSKKGPYRKSGQGAFGAEFVAQSVSSANADEYLGRFWSRLANGYMRSKKRNPHVRYVNVRDHGYMLLDLSEQEAKATWFFTKQPYVRTLAIKKPVAWSLQYNGGLSKVKPNGR
jgi:alkaline phosphatase D